MKKTIIVIIVVIVLMALGVGAFLFLNNRQATTTPTPPGGPAGQGTTTQGGGTTSEAYIGLGDSGITSSEIAPGAPSDAPQGPTLSFQTASGTITLNNFYTTARGYWAPLNVLLLADSPAYAIWYYRDSSAFEIDVPPDGGLSDEDSAASQLSGMLGISQQELCALPLTVVFQIADGGDSATAPLDSCIVPGVINSQ